MTKISDIQLIVLKCFLISGHLHEALSLRSLHMEKERECILWIENQEFCHINVRPWIILRSEGKKLHHRYNLLVKRKALCCNSNGNKYGLENEEISVGCSMHSHPLIPCLDTMLWSQVWNAFLVEFDRQEEELPFLIHNSSHWI